MVAWRGSPQLVYDSGIIVRNPNAAEVVKCMTTIRDYPDAGFTLGPYRGLWLIVHVISFDEFHIEFSSEQAFGECKQKDISFNQIIQILTAFVSGDLTLIRRLEWQEYAIPAGAALQVGDKLYRQNSKGWIEPMSLVEAKRKLVISRAIEAVLLLPWLYLLVGVVLDSDKSFAVKDSIMAVLSVVVFLIFAAIGWSLHSVNWRCPACGKALGPLPRRQCKCTWHGPQGNRGQDADDKE